MEASKPRLLIPGLRGTLHLIDDEIYDDTNAERYVETDAATSGSKVKTAAAKFAPQPALVVVPHQASWDAYLIQRNNWELHRVAVAVDSAEDRCLIQASLPRSIINSWTQPDNVGISRHDFLTSACLTCLYLPAGEVPDQDDVVAAALRFEVSDLKLVRELLDTNRLLADDLVAKIEQQVNLTPGALGAYVGRTLIELYQREVCGGRILHLGGTTGDATVQTEVPMAFQSAMAGIMLAAEIVCDSAQLRSAPLPVRTELNLLRPLKGTLNSPEAKHHSGRCLCQDDDYQLAYREKYSAT